MLRTNLWKILLCALVGALVALGVSLLMPRKYEGVVQILVDQKPLTANIPMSGAEEGVSDLVDFGRSRGIATQVDQLSSLGVLSAAARAVKNRYPDLDDEALEPRELMENVSISAETVSDLITVRVHMPTPESARAMAEEIYNAFNDANIGRSRALGQRAVSSLEMQAADIRQQLDEVDRQTSSLRSQFQAPNVESQIQSDIGSVAQLKQALSSTQAELSGASQQAASLAGALSSIPATIPGAQSRAENPAAVQMERDLALAQSERAKRLVEYHADAPEIRELDEQIRRLSSELNRARSKTTTTTSSVPNPERQQMAIQLAQARAREASLRDSVRTIQAELAGAQANLVKYPAIQKRMADLNRKQLSLEKLYQSYQDRLQTLRTRQTGRVAASSIVGGPMAYPFPVSPKIGINALLGALLGLAAGFVWMMLSEARNQPIRTLGQLNALSYTPVYRLLPELRVPFLGLGRPVHESFERLLVHYRSSDKRPYRLGVIGLVGDSGASVTSANLAASVVRQGGKASLVEYDARHPQQSRFAKEEQLQVVGPDAIPTSSDLIVYDFEPSTQSADYAFVANELDEAIVLVRANHVRSVDFLQLQQSLQDAGCPLVTVVFSRTSSFNAVSEPLVVEPDVKALSA